MSDLRIEGTRGDLVETVHRVSAAVVDRDGRLVAESGDPDLVTFWRSAAKPFQAMALVQDGAADRFGLTDRELALCCASHSSEPVHLQLADSLLNKLGLGEAALACGSHTPLGPAVAEQVAREGITLTPRWSNCSGKHAGMLALALGHGWPAAGYHERGHPVQQRIEREVCRWTGLEPGDLFLAVDGCNTVCFGLPLRAMAWAYARLVTSDEPAPRRIREAMAGHPAIIAGQGRPCTDLMTGFQGRLLAKIGAEGVYCAALADAGLGIALKVADGDMRSAPLALAAVLRALLEHTGDANGLAALARSGVLEQAPIRNTRGVVTGDLRARGSLRFL